MSFSDWHMHFVLGFAVLVPLAARRFASPTWSRSYTTAGRYYGALTLYLASQTLLYYLISAALLSGIGHAERVSPLASPLVVALFLGVLMPSLGVMRHLECVPREWARRLAEIPAYALRLVDELEQCEFRPPEHTQPQVRSVLASRGLADEGPDLPGTDAIVRRLRESACLLHQVRAWKDDRRLRRFVSGSLPEFDALEKRFDRLAIRLPRSFGNIERFAISLLGLLRRRAPASVAACAESDREVGEVLTAGARELLHDAREDVDAFRSSLCLYVARGVLSTEFTAGARLRRLQSLGFCPQPRQDHASKILMQCFTIIVACLFVSFAALGTGTGAHRGDVIELATKVIMIATMQVVALSLAIVPKQRYGFANPGLDGSPPRAFLLLVGSVAMLCAAPISVLFKSLISKDVVFGIEQLQHTYPWFLMCWFTATATAWLVQDDRWHDVGRPRQRLLDMLVMVIGMAATFLLVRAALVGINAPRIPPYEMILAVVTIGAFVGYLVPAEFRNTPVHRRHPLLVAGNQRSSAGVGDGRDSSRASAALESGALGSR